MRTHPIPGDWLRAVAGPKKSPDGRKPCSRLRIRIFEPFGGERADETTREHLQPAGKHACARRTLTQLLGTNERIEPQHKPDETEPHWLPFRFRKDTL
jgi:hypothetical protein